MNAWTFHVRPVTDADLLGQTACVLLGAALAMWAVCAVCDLLEREL